MPKVVDGGGRLCIVKNRVQEVNPCENSRAVHMSPHNSETVTDSEKSSIKANRNSTMGFPWDPAVDPEQFRRDLKTYLFSRHLKRWRIRGIT